MTRTLLTPALLAVLASACVLAPYDGQVLEPHRSPIAFNGYALNPSAQVEIQAYNHCEDGAGQDIGWRTLTTTTSEPWPSLWAGYTGYAWSGQVGMMAVPDWVCYAYNGTTPHPDRELQNGSQITFRVVASSTNLYTFDGQGQTCVMEKVQLGEDLWLAADACDTNQFYTVHDWAT